MVISISSSVGASVFSYPDSYSICCCIMGASGGFNVTAMLLNSCDLQVGLIEVVDSI